jgi:large subunit ribosomal protein L20
MRINAAARLNGTIYSKFMDSLKKRNIELDRKVLAEIAMKHPEVFAKLVKA